MPADTVPRLVLILTVLAVLLGTALRFTHLEDKVYWHDEAHTALRVSGNTTPDFVDQVFANRILTPAELQAFQRPRADQGYADTWRALSTRPEHGPLYYLLARAGFYFTDDARLATRSVAALLSLLLFPAAYWLWRELAPVGNARLGAALLIGLLAVSPFQLIYAQEARQYSLWAVMTLAVCAALLRARRRDDRAAWSLYALTVAVGLYTHLMLAVVVAVQSVWLGWETRMRDRVQRRRFVWSLLGATLLFLPWLWLFLGGLKGVGDVTHWMSEPMLMSRLVEAWCLHLTRLYMDGEWVLLGVPAAIILALFALYGTWRAAAPSLRRLLLMILVVTTAVVVGPDLISGGRRSLEARYLLPALLMLSLMLSIALARELQAPSATRRAAGLGLWVILLGLGLYSDLSIVRAEAWWNKSMSAYNHQVARLINQADRPLVILPMSDINPGEVLSVSYQVDPDTRFLLLRPDSLPVPMQLQGTVFILNGYAGLREYLSAFGTLTRIHKQGRLWRLDLSRAWHALPPSAPN